MDMKFLLWDCDLEIRSKTKEDFKKNLGQIPIRKEILSDIETDISNLSEKELLKAKEIADIIMALLADESPLRDERGFSTTGSPNCECCEMAYGSFVNEIREKYQLPNRWSMPKWFDNYTDEEIIICLKILEKVGDLTSLGLIINCFEHIYDMYLTFSLPNLTHVRDELIQSSRNTIYAIGRRANKKLFHRKIINLLKAPIDCWENDPRYIEYGNVDECLGYTKEYFQELKKIRMDKYLKDEIEKALEDIERISKEYDSGIWPIVSI